MAMTEALKEEKERQVTPAPAPVAGGNRQGGGPRAPFTLQVAEQHVPAHVVKLLSAQVKPLADDALPEPADLTPFWGKVERALVSLDPSFGAMNHLFREPHVQNLGPYILGAKGW